MLENEKRTQPETKESTNFAAIVEAAENSCMKATEGPKIVLQIVKLMASVDAYPEHHVNEFTSAMGELIEAHEKTHKRLRALAIKMAADKK